MTNNKTILIKESFEYIDIGSGDVVLLIHGWLDSKEDWEFNINELADKFRVITFDLPGCNGVKDICRTDLEGYLEFINSFVEALALKKFAIVGHSLGATIALEYSLRHKENVNKIGFLGLILTPTSRLKIQLSKLILKLSAFKIFLNLVEKLKKSKKYMNYILKITADPHLSNYEKSAKITMKGLINGTSTAYINGYSSILTLNSIKSLRELDLLNIPYLLMYGKNDEIVSIKLVTDLDFIEKKLYLFSDSKHCPNRQKPKEFNQKVLDFL